MKVKTKVDGKKRGCRNILRREKMRNERELRIWNDEIAKAVDDKKDHTKYIYKRIQRQLKK